MNIRTYVNVRYLLLNINLGNGNEYCDILQLLKVVFGSYGIHVKVYLIIKNKIKISMFKLNRKRNRSLSMKKA